MIAMAIGAHIGPPPSQSGNRPAMVVAVVSKMGRNRSWAARTTAAPGTMPPSISSCTRSSSTMALLMTIPANEMIPRKVMNPM